MERVRSKYSSAFKISAVKLVLEEKRRVSDVARDLGIGENMLWRWKKEYEDSNDSAFPGKGHLSPEDEEQRKIQREILDLKEENEILKKALAIFSKGRK